MKMIPDESKDVKWPLTFAWNLLFQTISFPGLSEREVAQFLFGLRRLNKIAEVQMWSTMGNFYISNTM